MKTIKVKVKDKATDINEIKTAKKLKKDSIALRMEAWQYMSIKEKKNYLDTSNDKVMINDYEDWLEGNVTYAGLE